MSKADIPPSPPISITLTLETDTFFQEWLIVQTAAYQEICRAIRHYFTGTPDSLLNRFSKPLHSKYSGRAPRGEACRWFEFVFSSISDNNSKVLKQEIDDANFL